MENKKGFLLYPNYKEQIDLMSTEEKAELLDAIFNYQNGEDVGELSGITKMAFSFIKAQFDRDNEAWESTVNKRIEAGRKGGLKKADNSKTTNNLANVANASFAKNEVANVANANFATENLANLAVNVNDNVNDNDNKKVTKVTKKAGAFFPDPELDKAFNEFVEMRKKLRAPMTDRAIQLAVNRLNELSRGDPNTALIIVNQSILNGWKSFYEPKTTKSSNFNERQFDAQELERELLRGVP